MRMEGLLIAPSLSYVVGEPLSFVQCDGPVVLATHRHPLRSTSAWQLHASITSLAGKTNIEFKISIPGHQRIRSVRDDAARKQ